MPDMWDNIAEQLLTAADIKINGDNPWDIKVHNKKLFKRVFKYHNLGLGEAYMEGWWDCEALDEFIRRILSAKLDVKVLENKQFLFAISWLKLRELSSRIFNHQSEKRALLVGEKHYDIGNDLYEIMLDKNLNYTCGYWKNAQSLDEAQIAKMDLTCKKLYLKPGMKILDIGCGFGTFARFAAQNYGAHVVGVTISREQERLAKELCQGLPVEIRFLDYRKLNEKFDRISSLGMFEHVGYKNYATFMRVADQCLNDEGIFLLHTIGSKTTTKNIDPWFNRYIFPNGQLPSIAQIGHSIENHFIMQDWHNFGLDYAKTLKSWYENFMANKDQLNKKYDETFVRMWRYYLLSSAGGFLSKNNQLWQIVLTKTNYPYRYEAVR